MAVREKSMGKLEGKVCIITGGGTGIGRGTARAFAKEGATLVLAARQLDRLNDSAERCGATGSRPVRSRRT